MQYDSRAITMSLVVFLAIGLSGCGGGGSSSSASVSSGSATIMIAGNSNVTSPRNLGVLVPEDLTRVTSRSPVDVDDIESPFVTITEITLDRVGNPEPGGGEDDEDDVEIEVSNYAFTPEDVDITVGETVKWVWTEDGPHTVTSGVRGDLQAGDLFDAQGELTDDFFIYTFQGSGDVPYFSDVDFDAATGMIGAVHVGFDNSPAPPKITVFRGAIRVNLKELDAVSEILSMADIPAGQYNGIRLSIENPELVLVGGDPEAPITDIQLTANGRLFIKEKFEVVEGENVLIIIDFGSIHLVETGSGSYVLTPQLSVQLDLVSADVEITGIITSVDSELTTITVMTEEGDEILVDVSEATLIAYSDDTEAAFDDFAVDQMVEVEGTLNVDNSIDAERVEIELAEE